MAWYFNPGKTHLVSFNFPITSVAIHVKTNGSNLNEKLSFGMLVSSLCCKLDWGSYIVLIAETIFKKIGAFICSCKFFSSEVALPYGLAGNIYSYLGCYS